MRRVLFAVIAVSGWGFIVRLLIWWVGFYVDLCFGVVVGWYLDYGCELVGGWFRLLV